MRGGSEGGKALARHMVETGDIAAYPRICMVPRDPCSLTPDKTGPSFRCSHLFDTGLSNLIGWGHRASTVSLLQLSPSTVKTSVHSVLCCSQ
jgi:hypothetical protein